MKNQELSLKIKQLAQEFPLTSGVYMMIGENQEILYIGKAKSLRKRVLSYSFLEKLPHRLKRMVSLVSQISYQETTDEAQALLLEAHLIKKHKPAFNVLLKDDKSYPFLVITQDELPSQLKKERRKEKQEIGLYFGPFACVKAVNESMDLLSRLFMLRTCADTVFKNRTRPCLQYHIKRCSGPCVGLISKDDYKKNVMQAKDFLEGKTKHVHTMLYKEMLKASQDHLYEKATVLRDRIRYLHALQSQGNHPFLEEADVFSFLHFENKMAVCVAFYRSQVSYGQQTYIYQSVDINSFISQFYEGKTVPKYIILNQKPDTLLKKAFSFKKNPSVTWHVPHKGVLLSILSKMVESNKEALDKMHSQEKMYQDLQIFFGLSLPIERIEVFDNSHLMGKNPYGAMIVATPQKGFDFSSYRLFKMPPGGDDYAMMKEMFQRRLNSLDPLPSIMLIDGGKGHLNIVQNIFAQTPVFLVAISKGKERNKGGETLHFIEKQSMVLDNDTPIFRYLQRLRDEAHRFAITTHRKGREKSMLESKKILGIGPKRRKALIAHFGSLAKAYEADIQELLRVDGISMTLAKSLKDQL